MKNVNQLKITKYDQYTIFHSNAIHFYPVYSSKTGVGNSPSEEPKPMEHSQMKPIKHF